jgi:hypothetical protein
MTIREAAFRCTWFADDEERRAYVRAWTMREAVELLRAELRAEGLALPDDVTVVELGRPAAADPPELR